jgi:ribonuclease HII
MAAIRIVRFMLSGTPHSEFVSMLGARGIVAGVDEAGRGPLAGPVVAAAVVLCKPRPAGLDDSKRLSEERREALERPIRRRCAFGIGVVGPDVIDRINVFAATMLAMTEAVIRLEEALGAAPVEVMVDGNLTPAGRCDQWRWHARPIVGGDASEPAISAASILAKTWRDRLMRKAALDHPHYGWERNKGYGTPDHLIALREHGPCDLHRKSFAPVAQMDMFAA